MTRQLKRKRIILINLVYGLKDLSKKFVKINFQIVYLILVVQNLKIQIDHYILTESVRNIR